MAEKPYNYIRAWGHLVGTKAGWVEFQVRLARKQHAPTNSIYWSGGKWVTFNDIPSPSTLEKVANLVKKIQEGVTL